MKACYLRTLILATALLVNSGCMLLNLRRDLKEIEKAGTLQGSVQSKESGNIVVAPVRFGADYPAVVNYRVLSGEQTFQFLLEPGTYQVFAYRDRNGDLKYQSNEPVVRSDKIGVSAGEKLAPLKLVLPSEPEPELIAAIDELKATGKKEIPKFKEYLGKVVTLSDEAFTDANSHAGMWEPLRFVREVPFGIFFLEEYDPSKIPVLFVHGINGHPGNFKDLVGRLDRSRFQAWVAYYPSGFRLDTISQFLAHSLNELYGRYRFAKMRVVAHSMGGLVSRAVILETAASPEGTFVDRFISLSTPWGGHTAAAIGANAPVVMPVWIDMAPESEFLRELFKRELPVRRDLLFSFHGSGDDGVVSLASQLHYDAQRKARLVRGFDADHAGILRDKHALAAVQALLR